MNPHHFLHLFNYPPTVPLSSYHLNPMLNALNFPPIPYDQLLPRPQGLPLLQFENSTFKNLRTLPKMHTMTGFSPQEGFDLQSLCSTPALQNELMLTRSLSERSNKAGKIPEKAQSLIHAKSLRKDLEKMIKTVMVNINGNNQKAITKERQSYVGNEVLLEIYDKLVLKYKQSKRCKEDIIRYILRKVFKTLRSKVMNENKVSNKKASFLMCQQYFELKFNEIKKSGVNMEDEEGLLEFFMPYNKKSKNRTMNSSFIDEIFSSEKFCEDYKYFLDNQFERFLQADNNRKIKKLIDFLIVCIEKDNISKLDKFNRLPWLDLWLQDARENAASLLPEKESHVVEKKRIKGKQ